MLRSLYISNYVLIEHLNIDFSHGFTAITGETGAGKSVLLGAIALITGERADLSLIRNREKKCVVEAVFVLKNALPKKFFTENDLEVQPELILRRELLPGGTSRAFINDSPVNLSLMKAFGAMIIDIHSQHENLLVKDNHFQLNIIDSLAGNFALVQDYAEIFSDYQKIKSQLREAVEKDDAARKEYDYLLFQYNQIDEAGIKEGELKELETEQNILTNAGDILAHLDFCATALETGQNPLLLSVKELIQHFEQLKKHLPEAANWTERIQSIHIEMRDLLHEVEKQAATTEVSPQRLDVVNQRLDAIYSLLHKHKLESDTELIALAISLKEKIAAVEAFSDDLEGLKKKLASTESTLKVKAEALSKKRHGVIPKFEKTLAAMAVDLGMPNVQLKAVLKKAATFHSTGNDDIEFLFTANPKMPLVDISKAASGGELSRIMLCLKSMVATNRQIPVLIFDEIDTGLSGEIAHKMSLMLQKLAEESQIIVITHLPQIAASGNDHMLVYKTSGKDEAYTLLKKLSSEERIDELAKMLSGKEVTAAAVTNAKVLLGIK